VACRAVAWLAALCRAVACRAVAWLAVAWLAALCRAVAWLAVAWLAACGLAASRLAASRLAASRLAASRLAAQGCGGPGRATWARQRRASAAGLAIGRHPRRLPGPTGLAPRHGCLDRFMITGCFSVTVTGQVQRVVAIWLVAG
jgi:hypothetical protein